MVAFYSHNHTKNENIFRGGMQFFNVKAGTYNYPLALKG
jgi:hypothetical protein